MSKAMRRIFDGGLIHSWQTGGLLVKYIKARNKQEYKENTEGKGSKEKRKSGNLITLECWEGHTLIFSITQIPFFLNSGEVTIRG